MLDQIHAAFGQVLAEAESLVASGELIKLFALSDNLDKIEKELNSLEYLAALSETDLIEKYYPAILSDNASPFSNFTSDDRDTYIRLKFKAINKRN